MAIFT